VIIVVKTLLEDLKKRLEKAKEELNKLNTLIEVAEDAGEDVTEYKIKRDELAEKIRRWEDAISKRL